MGRTVRLGPCKPFYRATYRKGHPKAEYYLWKWLGHFSWFVI